MADEEVIVTMLRVAALTIALLIGCATLGCISSGPVSAPTPSTGGIAVGDIRLIRTADPARPWFLMVQEGAFRMQEKAFDEKDDRTLSSIWSTYERVEVTSGTPVLILKFDGQTAQVEVVDGPSKGRRGWVSRLYLGQQAG